ncbi:Mitochondrial inner membrane protease subunit 1 [Glycine soja]|uniref:Mitochondrial inner membrane protease subunit 1 n=1 Tax=Glycine soja TaxID=3848 RepID=A0A0B2ST84_GLYSO|nr:Mitochondrial inner membrane protease subunit 1 [Glycine soja]
MYLVDGFIVLDSKYEIQPVAKSGVPKGHVWIQGDNIYASRDSRHFGPVPYGLIEGKVFFRVWPPDSFGPLGR